MTIYPCSECGRTPVLVRGSAIWPQRPDLADKPVWQCQGCPESYVGCHPGTDTPLGTPAGAKLRHARRVLHEGRLDPLWKFAGNSGVFGRCNDSEMRLVAKGARHRVYAFLADRLSIDRDQCHVAMFDIERCRDAWKALENVTYAEIHDWATKHRPVKKSAPAPHKGQAA